MTPFVARVQVRFTDLDTQGHVNNVVFVEYLQQARAQFLLSGRAAALLDTGCIVVSHQVAYQAPIWWSDDPIEIELRVAEVGAARFVVAYRIIQDGRQCAQASTVLCPFDFETQAPRRLNTIERAFLVRYLASVEPLPALDAPELAGRGVGLEVQTRWSDADRYGHINNVQYVDYVLAGRLHTTTAADPAMARVGTGNPDSVHWLVARQDIDYLVQMDFRLTPYTVLTAPTRVGNTSLVLATEITDASGVAYARARCVLVCANPDGTKRPLPDSARAAMTEILVQD